MDYVSLRWPESRFNPRYENLVRDIWRKIQLNVIFHIIKPNPLHFNYLGIYIPSNEVNVN